MYLKIFFFTTLFPFEVRNLINNNSNFSTVNFNICTLSKRVFMLNIRFAANAISYFEIHKEVSAYTVSQFVSKWSARILRISEGKTIKEELVVMISKKLQTRVNCLVYNATALF